MMPAASNSLPVITNDEDCACLGGALYAAVLAAAGYALFFLSLAWLLQATRSAAPGAAWWKSAFALALVLACTWFLRMARRLDPHAKRGWTLFDAALFLAGGLVATIFVMRGGPFAGTFFICLFLVQEGLSLWRLKLLPKRLLQLRSMRPTAESFPNAEAFSSSPLSRTVGDELAGAAIESSGSEDSEVCQQFTRRETEETVQISGFVRGTFAAEEAIAVVDVSFCPTLEAQPSLEFEVTCDEEIEVRIATLRTYGARLEIKRKTELQHPLSFTLELDVVMPRSVKNGSPDIRADRIQADD